MIPTKLIINKQELAQPQPTDQTQSPTEQIQTQTEQTQTQTDQIQPPTEQNNDFISFDNLITEFETPKESTSFQNSIEVPRTDTQQPAVEPPTIFAPSAPTQPEQPPMTEIEAENETAKWMRFRENLQAYGISWYADGSFAGAEKYTYKPHQFNQLVKAWSPVVQRANVRLPPMADIALAELMCTGPLIGLMNQNRKYRKELAAARAQNEQLKQQLSDDLNKRRDAKYLWEIGENEIGDYGYFTRTPAGTYLAKDKRTERPKLTPENIELLIKHNGKAAVDRLIGK